MTTKAYFSFIYSSLALLVILFSSCKKEPEVIIETVTVTDTIVETVIDNSATTFILVRHAEIAGGGTNPNLSAAGLARAEDLKNVLSNVNLDAVFSTTYNRTTQTATPTATDKGLSIQNYDGFDLEPVVDDNIANYPEGAVLVVGHSNTTPALLNLLTGSETYADLPETEFNNLFVVTVYQKGNATVLEMKYGE